MIRVLVADDYALIRDGLVQWLSCHDDIEVVGVADDGPAAVAKALDLMPDVVLMDLAMEGGNGVDATAAIAKATDRIAVIVLTTFLDATTVRRVFDAGAKGYLLKDTRPDALLEAIRSVYRGGMAVGPKVAPLLVNAPSDDPASGLTPREREILRLIADGLGNKQIARLLTISETTVKTHCTNLFVSIGVTDRTQAAIWALKHLPECRTDTPHWSRPEALTR